MDNCNRHPEKDDCSVCIQKCKEERDALKLQVDALTKERDGYQAGYTDAEELRHELELQNHALKDIAYDLAKVLQGGYQQGDNGQVVDRNLADKAVRKYCQLALDEVNKALGAEKQNGAGQLCAEHRLPLPCSICADRVSMQKQTCQHSFLACGICEYCGYYPAIVTEKRKDESRLLEPREGPGSANE